MFNVIIIPHIRTDSTGDCDMHLSVLQIPGPTFSSRTLADLDDFLGLTGPCSAVAQISGGAFNRTAKLEHLDGCSALILAVILVLSMLAFQLLCIWHLVDNC